MDDCLLINQEVNTNQYKNLTILQLIQKTRENKKTVHIQIKKKWIKGKILHKLHIFKKTPKFQN